MATFNKTQEYTDLLNKYFGEGENVLKRYCNRIVEKYLNGCNSDITAEEIDCDIETICDIEDIIENDFDYQCVYTIIDYFKNQSYSYDSITDIFKEIISSAI